MSIQLNMYTLNLSTQQVGTIGALANAPITAPAEATSHVLEFYLTILNDNATNIPVLTHDAFVGFLEFNAFNPATALSGTDTITAALNLRTLRTNGATVKLQNFGNDWVATDWASISSPNTDEAVSGGTIS